MQETANGAMAETGSNIPKELLAPTYQNRLRAIGRYLDVNEYRHINILQAEGGFVVRAETHERRAGEILEFTDDIFPELIKDGFASRGTGQHIHVTTPILPTGYEDFLRALGYRMDVRTARAVSIFEGQEFILISGQEREDTFDYSGYAHFEQLLYGDEIKQLLDEAFRRRRKGAGPEPVSSDPGVGMSRTGRKLNSLIKE